MIHKSTQLKSLAQSIGRLSYSSVARQTMKVDRVRKRVMEIIAADIQKELTRACARRSKSVLRNPTAESLINFTWEKLLSELDTCAPTFMHILRGIVQVKRRERKPVKRSYRPSEKAVLGVCAAIMLKNRNVHMNLLQCIVSLILYNGHASKQVRTYILNECFLL